MAVDSAVWPKLPIMAAKLAVLEQAPVASLWVDAKGNIGFVNQRFCEAMGYNPEFLVGSQLSTLVPSLTDDYWQEGWWPLLVKEQHIPVMPFTWQHIKGVNLNFNASVSLVEVAELNFVVFYLWPMSAEQPQNVISFSPDDRTLLQNLDESVCLLDKFGVIRFVNKAFCKLMAGSERSLLGVPMLELIAPNKSQLSEVWDILQNTHSKTECEIRNLAGQNLHIRMAVAPLSDDSQATDQFLVSFVDITEQVKMARELEVQNASFERLASNIPGFIYKFKMTPDGTFAFPYASHGCKEIFGVDPDKVVNDATPIIQTIHPDDLPKFQNSVLESAIQLSPWNFEARQITSKGDWKWFHAASRPQLQDNGDIVWEGLVMDVTPQKKVEQELAEAKVAAEASAVAKAEFLANMSHEIRTPLNAIIGLNQLVLKSELNLVQRDYLKKVQLSSENLLSIINNILDFSKIESGKLNIEHIEFNLDTVLENIGIMLEPIAAEKQLDLLIDREQKVPIYIIGDSLRLTQVLTNLCSNAIKFTEHGEVIISVRQMPNDDAYQKIRFSVKDTGIGLSERQKSKIFEAFTQANSSTTRNYGGTGLGLSITKHLIELMGGEIGVNSIEGKGSEFYFTLPLLKHADPDIDEIVPEELKGWHVLLIMENESATRIFAKMLKDLHFKVTVASLKTMRIDEILKNQGEAEQTPHELVLLDWKINESHKAEVIKALELKAFGDQVPIIINISVVQVEQAKQITNECDNIIFMNKPSTPSCLMDAMINASGKDILIDSYKTKMESSNLAFYEEAVKGIRVLLAEDNQINQEVARKTLENAGISVDVVGNGKEAVEWLMACDAEASYDAVLMDLQMPIMDGYEATKVLRRDKRFDALPIIAMTAHTIETDKQQCLACGMQDHIGKPIDLEQMFSKLARWTRIDEGHLENTPDRRTSKKSQIDTPQTTLSSLTTVNVRSALALLQGDEKVLLQLLMKFARDESAADDQIKQHLDAGNWLQAADKVHQIKGVAGNLYIPRVFEITVQLETALKNRDESISRQLLERFSAEFERFCKEIKGFNGPLSRPKDILEKTTVLSDEIEILEMLNQLIRHLESNSWQAEDDLSRVKLHLGDQYAQELSKINNLMFDLEFRTAAECVKRLRDKLYSSH